MAAAISWSSVTPSSVADPTTSLATPVINAEPNLNALNAALDNNALDNDSLEQVTAVSQLADVKPTDWAFAALQTLMERYGCIAGYPDRSYRGARTISRYEFAAGLNACIDRVNKLITTATADAAKQADLATLQKLQTEFAAELTTLRGRGDRLETRTATLEKQQFSSTTKLSGDVFFNLTGATTGRDVVAEGADGILPFRAFGQADRDGLNRPRTRRSQDVSTTLSSLVWLNLTSSFTGKDLLRVQLAAGNGVSPTNNFASTGLFNTWGAPYTDQSAGPNNGSADVVLREINYSFPINDQLQFVVGPRINFYRYFDNNRYTLDIIVNSRSDS